MATDPSEGPADKVREAFRALLAQDRARGVERGLVDYQRLFPGCEEMIEAELERILAARTDDSAPTAPAGTGAIGARLGDDRASADLDEPLTELGQYRIIRRLGKGGQGIVYLARDTRLGRDVALKILTEFTRENLRRFQREAEVASRLSHPGICTIYDSGQSDGYYFIAMRHVDGEALSTQIHRARYDARAASAGAVVQIPSGDSTTASAHEGPGTGGDRRRDLHRVLHFFERGARALHLAHEAGLIHRDIKPANIMVTNDGAPVLLDFGLARAEAHGEMTTASVAIGTPEYMSPEQLDPRLCTSGPRLDRRTDVYSLGVSLYECLTLRRPFDAPSLAAQYQKILGAEVPNPERLNPLVGRDLRAILETALHKDRNRRYATAEELAEELRRVRENEPVRARPTGPVGRLVKWSYRNPILAGAIAGLCLLVVVSMTALVALQRTRARERELSQDLLTQMADASAREAHAAHESFRTAQLLARDARWQAALDEYGRARQLGYPDRTELVLGEIEARLGNGDGATARQLLVALGTGHGDPHEARILLLRGDLLPDSTDDPEVGLDLVRQALAVGGLAPADDAFAQALLAPTIAELEQRIDEALAHDPRHRGANGLRGIVLLLTARFADAEQFAATYRILDPDDRLGWVIQAACARKLHGEVEWQRALAELDGKVDRESLLGLGEFVETFSLFEALEDGLLRAIAGEAIDTGIGPARRLPADPAGSAAGSAAGQAAGPGATAPAGAGGGPALADAASNGADDPLRSFIRDTLPYLAPRIVEGLRQGRHAVGRRMPIAIARAWWTFGGVFQRLIYQQGSAIEVEQAMTEAIGHMDDGVFHLIRAHARFIDGQLDASAADYRSAAQLDSLFTIRRGALLMAIHANTLLGQRLAAADPTAAAGPLGRSSQCIGLLLALGDHQTAVYRFAATRARDLGEPELALQVCESWTRRAADDADAWTTMAELVLAKGHLYRARELAAAALQLSGDRSPAARRCVERVDAALARERDR